MDQVRRCVSEESGATAVEYAIMAGFIATVIGRSGTNSRGEPYSDFH